MNKGGLGFNRKHTRGKLWQPSLWITFLVLLSGCSLTRHVPEGSYLLDNVSVNVDDSTKSITSDDLMHYVRQKPNNKFLHISRMRLGVYNMSGTDSTWWWNKWMRKLGEAPVIYSEEATTTDSLQLVKALRNSGFLGAKVNVKSIPDRNKRSIKLKYTVETGAPHIIRDIRYEFPDDSLRNVVMRDSARFIVRKGNRLDRNQLEQQREWITTRLRNRGYWGFRKEFITFSADTTEGSKNVELTMTLQPPYPQELRAVDIDTHRKYTVGRITVVTDYDNATGTTFTHDNDSVTYRDITVIYAKGRHYLSPSAIYQKIALQQGASFRQRDVDRTYEALGRLPVLKFIQVVMVPVGKSGLLDAYILLTPGKTQTVSLQLEGTNSEGDLGVGAEVHYSHRNIGHGSETLDLKLRGAYQALNGNLHGFIHNRYLEFSTEAAVTFPKFEAPFLKDWFKRKVRASTEVHLSLNYQERPEFTRVISAAGFGYKWDEHSSRLRYSLSPIDVSYVYLPKSTNDFIDKIAPDNPLLRYSYEDHFIMRMGFNFYYTNKRKPSAFRLHKQKDIIWVRAQTETAGNLLFAFSRLFNPSRDYSRDPYKVLGIRYAQYARLDADAAYTRIFDRKNSLACYVGFGIGVPYGNSSMLPFEKRFYGGGANGVRGWDVRTLGPGAFPGTNSVSDFIFQCGDIRLNMSVEYRAKLFWVLEGAAFIDAGNIWTIRNYDSQPYGEFKFNSFYKQLAASYGVGIRLDFNYFLIRLDLGMKAHNPAVNAEHWPLLHPRWGRDRSLHFSIGYPF